MTPPTEKFEPTPERVEEVARKWLKELIAFNTHCENVALHCARRHLAELHRETETLRSQVDASNKARESLAAVMEDNCRKIQDMVFERQQLWTERDALKAQVVAYEETKTYLVGYLTIHGEKDTAELVQFAFKQALTQLEAK